MDVHQPQGCTELFEAALDTATARCPHCSICHLLLLVCFSHLTLIVLCSCFPTLYLRFTLVLDMVFLSASPVCFFNLSLPFGFVHLYLRGHPQFSFVCGSKMNLFYFLVLQLQSCLHLASCLPHRLHTSWQHLVVFFWCENAIQGKKKKKWLPVWTHLLKLRLQQHLRYRLITQRSFFPGFVLLFFQLEAAAPFITTMAPFTPSLLYP